MTTNLTALLVWYFIEGVYNRREDRPNAERSNVQRYVTRLQGPIPELVFYRSPATQRWWMEVPCPETLQRKKNRYELVPCSHQDYRTAQENEIPNRWWIAHYRMGA